MLRPIFGVLRQVVTHLETQFLKVLRPNLEVWRHILHMLRRSVRVLRPGKTHFWGVETRFTHVETHF